MYEMEGPNFSLVSPARLRGWQPNPRFLGAARPTTDHWYPLQGRFPGPRRVRGFPRPARLQW